MVSNAASDILAIQFEPLASPSDLLDFHCICYTICAMSTGLVVNSTFLFKEPANLLQERRAGEQTKSPRSQRIETNRQTEGDGDGPDGTHTKPRVYQIPWY